MQRLELLARRQRLEVLLAAPPAVLLGPQEGHLQLPVRLVAEGVGSALGGRVGLSQIAELKILERGPISYDINLP